MHDSRSASTRKALLRQRAALFAALANVDTQLAELDDDRETTVGRGLHSQLDGQRPPGVGRIRYLRAWRRGRDAGDPEVTADGRARLMTPAAWTRHGASTPTRRRAEVPPPTIANTLRDDVLSELGATRRCG